MTENHSTLTPTPPLPNHFLSQIIQHDLAQSLYAERRWSGQPGGAEVHQQAPFDPARIRTRFPPEPNGYLHIGHAKSICLNFGLALAFDGVCHMRFDDTNPEKEEQAYVDAILDAVQWLGFSWTQPAKQDTTSKEVHHLYFASDYFEWMYQAAEYLITQGLAYVDEQSTEEMRLNRGDSYQSGHNSPYRDRSITENLDRFRAMRRGELSDGAAVLRAKIDMQHPNLNLRDPALYRIRRAHHHRTGDAWCLYPMYTYAHPIEDALENITHSICTLEFEAQRPFYDWLMGHLQSGGLIQTPPPKQIEFSRLNLTYVVTSKRKLKQLIDEKHVLGWDDPRLPTLAGLRRRGYTPSSIRLFCERIGVTKSDSWIDYSVLEGCLREDLENTAHRGMAVLDPIPLILTNWADVFGDADYTEVCHLPRLPHESHDDLPPRNFLIGQTVWIERDDFAIQPPKGYKRLFVGNKVRLKGGYVVECTGYETNEQGSVLRVMANVIPDTKSGTAGANSVKAKAAITWVAQADGVPATVHLYERLFHDAQPDANGKDFVQCLNPQSLLTVQAVIEPTLAQAQAGESFQFERHGYFVADRLHHTSQNPVFNRSVSLKDGW